MHLKDPLMLFRTGIKGTQELLDIGIQNDCSGFLFVLLYEIYGDVSQKEVLKKITGNF